MRQHAFVERLRGLPTVGRTGKVSRIFSTHVEADGPNLPLGALCTIETGGSGMHAEPVLAEVVRVDRESVVLMPFQDRPATYPGARVLAATVEDGVPVGDAFLGRAVDALGRPIDGAGPIPAEARRRLAGEETGPLDRISPKEPMGTGIRAIDSLLTLGRGQRVGIFAAAGVGKTSLLTQLACQVDADRIVICLVGERGREVEALWAGRLPAEARARATLVAATSDQAAAMRVRAGEYALALAEHWRAEGHRVVLLLDSVTRLAMALREIGLAAGEPPTVRAYTPSVFAALPKLVERCGALKTGGSITALMTVLAETDDVDDPVAETMKSLLDGHLILSRKLAEQGHFPAIDVPKSISRLAGEVTAPEHRARAERAIALLSAYEGARSLIESGLYAAGSNADIDRAIERRPALLEFLRQRPGERTSYKGAFDRLDAALGGSARR
jgi:flagellum-specific ATP synthase